MLAKEVYPDRRCSQRLNEEFAISLPYQVKGRTKNVSASGASFEVIMDDIDAFCPGTIIPLEITTIYMKFDSTVMKFCLSGKGLIICREVIEETTGCGIKLNLTVQFVEKLTME
jgi:hypothetical protein